MVNIKHCVRVRIRIIVSFSVSVKVIFRISINFRCNVMFGLA